MIQWRERKTFHSMTLFPHHGTMKHLKTVFPPMYCVKVELSKHRFYARTCLHKHILKRWEGMLNSVLTQMMLDKFFLSLAAIDSLTFHIFKHSWIRWYSASKLQLICKEWCTFLHPQNLHRGTNYVPNAAQLEVNISGGVWGIVLVELKLWRGRVVVMVWFLYLIGSVPLNPSR